MLTLSWRVERFIEPVIKAKPNAVNRPFACWDASCAVGIPKQTASPSPPWSAFVLVVSLSNLRSACKGPITVVNDTLYGQSLQWTNQNPKLIRKARENECERVAIRFGFTPDWMTKLRHYFEYFCACVWNQNNIALSYQVWTRCRGRGQGGSNDWVSPSSMYASPIRPGLLSTTNQIAACKGKWHVRTFHILIIKLPSSFFSLCRSSYSCIGIISTFPILHLLGLWTEDFVGRFQ